MEALIYGESPIAEYLQADALPYEIEESTNSTPSTFAPKGLPKLRDRLLQLRNTASSVTDSADQQTLERFRYIIVASQLLSDEPKPRSRLVQDADEVTDAFSLRGVLFAASVSFTTAFLLHIFHEQTTTATQASWSQICIYIISSTALAATLFLFGRRQYVKIVRRSAMARLSTLVNESHTFDAAAGAALRYIQEVEVVARGYNINYPLPPISRLDDKADEVRCRGLRSTVALGLSSSISQYVYFHNAIQPLVAKQDLETYHDIYEVSLKEYADAIRLANSVSVEAQNSLKELRFLFRLHAVARKVFLCDLLALHSGSTWYKIQQWRMVSHSLQSLVVDSQQNTTELNEAVAREENRDIHGNDSTDTEDLLPNHNVTNLTPHRAHSKAQIRRFEAVASGVRSLNAKVHLLRDEIHELLSTDADEAAVSSTLLRRYEHLGTDLRSLLVEWERGRNTMFLSVDSDRRCSRSSSSARSPVSPSPSLGGLTMVDGGPAEALKLLNGDEDNARTSDNGIPDEEVFEAIALPRKRMSLAFTREEKMAKLQENKRKRATLQEQAESTTNMLRELQMVIKHRPQSRLQHRPPSVGTS